MGEIRLSYRDEGWNGVKFLIAKIFGLTMTDFESDFIVRFKVYLGMPLQIYFFSFLMKFCIG